MGKVDLKLHRPEQIRPPRASRLGNTRRFGQWLQGLPMANVTAVGNDLLLALQEMNQTILAPRLRMDLLDLATGAILTVVDVLDRHVHDATFPLDEKRDRIGRVAIQFFRELGVGYRLAAADWVGGGTAPGLFRKRSVSRAVYQSLLAYEQMLRRLCLLYQEPPPGVWREVHRLYLFARQNELQQRTHDSPLRETAGDIDGAYLRISLFGISDCARLGQRAMRALCQVLELWRRRCHLVAGVSMESHDEGVFEIDPALDEPPQLVTGDQVPGRFDLVFDVRELRDWLLGIERSREAREEELTFRDPAGNPQVIDRELIVRLVRTWGVRRKRSYQRLPAHHQLRVVVGINAAHFVLTGHASFSSFLREHGDSAFAEAAAQSRRSFGDTAEIFERATVFPAEVLNQSIGGLRLRIPVRERLQLRVGEAVLVCAESLAETHPLWMLGLVRWLHVPDVREVELGVSLLGRRVRPAAVLEEASGREPVPSRALACDSFGAGPGAGGDASPRLVVSCAWAGAGHAAACIGGRDEPFSGRVRLGDREDRTSEVAFLPYEPA